MKRFHLSEDVRIRAADFYNKTPIKFDYDKYSDWV